MSCHHDMNRMSSHFIADRDASSQGGHFQNAFWIQQWLGFGCTGFRGAIQDGFDFAGGWKGHNQFEKKPVQLSFGEWVCALHFERILGCQHKEHAIELMRDASYSNASLLHGFEHGRLCLGSCSIDFVCEHDIGENRPAFKSETAAATFSLDQNGCSNQVRRHQVRRELNASEFRVECAGKCTDQHRFSESRYSLKQNVAARDQGQQDAIDNRLLSYNNLAYLLSKILKIDSKLIQRTL